MMGKEAILHKHVKFWNYKGEVAVDGIDTLTPESAIYKAMDEWGQQEAIAFGNWLQFNYQPHAETGYYYDHHKKGDEGVEDKFTTEELFNLFKNKKPHNLRQWIEDNEPFK
jgi:hypothetical protein